MNKYALIKRSWDNVSETAKYELIEIFDSEDAAEISAENTQGAIGDIFIICNQDQISDLVNSRMTMYVVGENEKIHRLPSVFSVTHKDCCNWIKAWEYSNLSAEGIFWMLFDVGVNVDDLRKTVIECVCFAASRCDQKESLEDFVNVIREGKADGLWNAGMYIKKLEDLKAGKDFYQRRMIDALIHAIFFIDKPSDERVGADCLSVALVAEKGMNEAFVGIFKSRFNLRDILLYLSRNW